MASQSEKIRVAILGAGIAGSCAALELASRGYAVDLFDEKPEPVSAASFVNEGKIHLGILYAKDPSLQTAHLMIEGALCFAPLLRRWTGMRADELALSTPFFYGVHQGTMVSVENLRAHYAACQRLFDDAIENGAEPYLGIDRSMSTQELSRSEMELMVDPAHFETVFRTTERGVDPRKVALFLRKAIQAEQRINFIGSARVTKVSLRDRGGLNVTVDHAGGNHHFSYDQVANVLWDGRLEIDAQMNLPPIYRWSYRYKLGNRIFVPLTATDLPSITCVLGPFGDIVNYQDNGLFLSWYPEGMIGTSCDLRPPAWNELFTRERRMAAFERSLGEWSKRCPKLSDRDFSQAAVDPAGGVIFAWGDTAVDDQNSKLHDRHEVGVYSQGCYHSVNTGKYTLGPWMGLQTAQRILGIS